MSCKYRTSFFERMRLLHSGVYPKNIRSSNLLRTFKNQLNHNKYGVNCLFFYIERIDVVKFYSHSYANKKDMTIQTSFTMLMIYSLLIARAGDEKKS